MSIFGDATYWVKRLLMGIYGPADLDPEHDPVQQLKHEHEEQVKSDEQPAAARQEPEQEPETQLEKEGREDWSIG